MDLKSEIDLFFNEFSEVESRGLGQALRSLAADAAFVEQSERILDHGARFTLLKRMASVRNMPPDILSELEGADARAADLREKRDALARTLSALHADAAPQGQPTGRRRAGPRTAVDVWIPTLDEIERCRANTAKLQATLQSFTRQVDIR